MVWLFGRKKKIPKVPLPEGKPFDEGALKFPTGPPSEKVIEPEQIKKAAGFEKPVSPPGEEAERQAMKEKQKEEPGQELPAQNIPTTPSEEPYPFPKSSPVQDEEETAPLFIKVEVYQRILGEIDSLDLKLNELNGISKVLEKSEYNEGNNFNKLKRVIKVAHDNLLQMDKIIFKV